MARSSRRRSSTRRKMQLDWVVNDDTYSNSPVSVGNGGIIAVPLVYPRFVLQEATVWNSPGAYAFPDAGRQFVKAVRGHFALVPGTWAAGSTFRCIARITKKPMDLATGDAVADALYSLDNAAFANERYAWQEFYSEQFAMGGSAEVKRVKATVNQWLEPDEGLYIIFHNFSGITQTLNMQMFLRSLVGAEGP